MGWFNSVVKGMGNAAEDIVNTVGTMLKMLPMEPEDKAVMSVNLS